MTLKAFASTYETTRLQNRKQNQHLKMFLFVYYALCCTSRSIRCLCFTYFMFGVFNINNKTIHCFIGKPGENEQFISVSCSTPYGL
jgi:hypothetical protein